MRGWRLLAGAAVVACMGCGPAGAVASITIAPLEASAQPGDTVQYSAAAFDSDGRRLTGVTFTWTTNNRYGATVSDTGLVTAGREGMVSVLAAFDGVSSERANLYVMPPPGPPTSAPEVTATAGYRSATLTWYPTLAPDAGSYAVYKAAGSWTTFSPGLPQAEVRRGVACCSVTFEGLTPETAYTFAVAATNELGEGPASAPVGAVPSGVRIAWSRKAPMPTPRAELGVAVLDGRLYAIGGESGSRLATVEVYDPATDTWTARAPMPTARAGLAVGAANGKIYAIGGRVTGDSNQPLSTVNEVYDPANDQWTTAAPLPLGTGRSCGRMAGASAGARVYVWPGQCSSPPRATLYEYNTLTDTWTARGEVPSGLTYDHQLVSDGTSLYGMQLGTVLVSAFSPATNAWTTLPALDVAGSGTAGPKYAALAASAEGVFAFGWTDRRFPIVLTMQGRYYQPALRAWLSTDPLQVPRWHFATASVGQQLFAVGGADPLVAGATVPLDVLEVGVVTR